MGSLASGLALNLLSAEVETTGESPLSEIAEVISLTNA